MQGKYNNIELCFRTLVVAQVVLKVDMMCEGCVNAVKRVLGKMEGASVSKLQLEHGHGPTTHRVPACMCIRGYAEPASCGNVDAGADMVMNSVLQQCTNEGQSAAVMHTRGKSLCTPSLAAAGVESFDVSLADQKVVVKGNVTPEAVLEKVSKTGRTVSVCRCP